MNQNIPYVNFKMEELPQKSDFLCKVDLKDAYFSVALNFPDIYKVPMAGKSLRGLLQEILQN